MAVCDRVAAPVLVGVMRPLILLPAAAVGAWDPDQVEMATLIDGLPTLAVEVLAPSDTVEDINEKVDAYLKAGVPLVWIIDPHRRTVTIHRPGAEPELVNVRQELESDPHLPGFRMPVARLFE